jgi:hypothetical protein
MTALLRGAAALLALVGVGLVGLGAVVAAQDAADGPGGFDGLGIAIGALGAGLGLVLVALAWLIWRLVGRNPMAAGLVSLAVGVTTVLASLPNASGWDFANSLIPWTIVAGLVFTWLGLLVVVGSRTGTSDSGH